VPGFCMVSPGIWISCCWIPFSGFLRSGFSGFLPACLPATAYTCSYHRSLQILRSLSTCSLLRYTVCTFCVPAPGIRFRVSNVLFTNSAAVRYRLLLPFSHTLFLGSAFWSPPFTTVTAAGALPSVPFASAYTYRRTLPAFTAVLGIPVPFCRCTGRSAAVLLGAFTTCRFMVPALVTALPGISTVCSLPACVFSSTICLCTAAFFYRLYLFSFFLCRYVAAGAACFFLPFYRAATVLYHRSRITCLVLRWVVLPFCALLPPPAFLICR